MGGRSTRWTDEQLRAAVAGSRSYPEIIERLGVERTASAYNLVHRHMTRLRLSREHLERARNRRPRGWTDEQLRDAVGNSCNVASVLRRLGLVPAGGNYDHVQATIAKLGLDTSHFNASRGGAGGIKTARVTIPLSSILVANRHTSSHKLKKRLFRAGLKQPKCELCGWAERASDGRIPIELDHINGDRFDNRLENLRILCPNCHSLQPTHRGLNQARRRR